MIQPLVTSATTTMSLTINSLIPNNAKDGVRRLRNHYEVAEFQRDSDQWDRDKKSLFIESIINGLTVPPIIVSRENVDVNGVTVEAQKIIDGQQRIMSIINFVNNQFALSSGDQVNYSVNVSAHIQNRTYRELDDDIKDLIENYVLNIILLPANLSSDVRLTIFRRINETGVPLSSQDLRLAEFGGSGNHLSPEVQFVRVTGIYDVDKESSRRMLRVAHQHGVEHHPWEKNDLWFSWWRDSKQAVGQAPSEMILHYFIGRSIESVSRLLADTNTLNSLPVKNDGTTISTLDIICAQFYKQNQVGHPPILPKLNDLRAYFQTFEQWFNTMRGGKITLSTNSAKKIAYFISSACQFWDCPSEVTDNQWSDIQVLLTKGPNDIVNYFQQYNAGITFQTSRGKWNSQKKQLESIHEICRIIHHNQ